MKKGMKEMEEMEGMEGMEGMGCCLRSISHTLIDERIDILLLA